MFPPEPSSFAAASGSGPSRPEGEATALPAQPPLPTSSASVPMEESPAEVVSGTVPGVSSSSSSKRQYEEEGSLEEEEFAARVLREGLDDPSSDMVAVLIPAPVKGVCERTDAGVPLDPALVREGKAAERLSLRQFGTFRPISQEEALAQHYKVVKARWMLVPKSETKVKARSIATEEAVGKRPECWAGTPSSASQRLVFYAGQQP